MIATKDECASLPASSPSPADRMDCPARPAVLPGISLSHSPHGSAPHGLPALPLSAGGTPDSAWNTSNPLGEPPAPTRLLIVDADTARGEQLARILAVPYDVQCVSDGETARVAVLAYRPDVLLVDLSLLRRRHFTLLRILQSGAGNRRIPVIATAAGADEDVLTEALEAGVDDFLLKPFSRSELFARLAAARARRMAAEERRDAEALQRILLDTLDDGVFIAQDRRLVMVNRAAAALLGYTPEGCTGLPFEAVVAEDELALWGERFRRTIGDGPEPHGRYEVAFLRQGGERRVLGMSLRRIRHDGRSGMLGILRETRAAAAHDLGERLRAEQALRDSEERFRRVVQQAPIPIFVHARDGQVLEVSAAVTRLTGWSRDDIPDARTWYLKGRRVPADKIEAALEEDRRRFLRDGIPEPREITVWTRFDEPRIWLVQDSAPMRLPDGRRLLASMAIDLTERRRAEEALRTAERQKDEFIAMLAHELRNPLAPIRNAAKVLREPQLAAPELHWVRDVIDRQVSQLSRLMDDLLDVSRVTHGILVLRRAPVDLAEVLEQAVEACLPAINGHHHTLRQILPGEAVRVEGDLPRLVQVFSNLLDNAARYTDSGGHIELILEATPSEAVVRVRDNGRGIAAELLPCIFELFTQDSRTLDRTQGGLGLGLALVRRLMEMHDGRVEAHSGGSGQGAEFVVRLPRIAVPVPAAGPGTEGKGPSPQPTTLRILVVDDNVDSADSMALLLSLDGHEVRTAFDGPGALAEAADFQPQAVLLDIGLPGMDGYEVARRMRELAGLRDVLMIAITGYGQEDDRTRSKAAGFDHHLVKPVDPETLSRLLGTLG